MGVEFESFKETGDIEYTADEGAACGINGCTNLSLVKSKQPTKDLLVGSHIITKDL